MTRFHLAEFRLAEFRLVARAAFCLGLSVCFFFTRAASAQEVQQDTVMRFSATVEKKINKEFRAFVNPEMRTDGFNPNRYLFELGVKYKPIDYLSLTPAYRIELREKNSGDLISVQRLRLDVGSGIELGDFEPSVRVRYSTSIRPDRETAHRLRYKLGLDYQIKKYLGADVSAELFHGLNLQEIEKMRYAAGLSYRFFRKKKKDLSQFVLFKYRFDYYLNEYRNAHIFELGYKFSF